VGPARAREDSAAVTMPPSQALRLPKFQPRLTVSSPWLQPPRIPGVPWQPPAPVRLRLGLQCQLTRTRQDSGGSAGELAAGSACLRLALAGRAGAQAEWRSGLAAAALAAASLMGWLFSGR
jgi:hypothetical protein